MLYALSSHMQQKFLLQGETDFNEREKEAELNSVPSRSDLLGDNPQSQISKPLPFLKQSVGNSINESPFSTFFVKFTGMVLKH